MIDSTLMPLAIALGIGLLVGIQREWVTDRVAGVRTFPLVALAGALSGLLSVELGAWIPAVGLASVTAILIMANFEDAEQSPGMTTEMAALVVFLVGVALGLGWTAPAVVVGGTVMVLLQAKPFFGRIVSKIGEADLRALAQLVLIGLVILPVLPDRAYGPLGVLNPYQIWLMVVLIVGISLAGYVAYRVLGAKAGVLLSGVLGGLISSTASTVTYARDAQGPRTRQLAAAVMIMIASTVVFARVLVEIAVVAPGSFLGLAPPLAAMMVAMVVVTVVMYVRAGEGAAAPTPDEPPTSLKAAIAFGLLYAVVLWAAAFARAHLNDSGLYVVAAMSGLTDMDAITLSTSRLVAEGRLAPETGWRMIMVGGISNLVFKAGIVATAGRPPLLRMVAAGFGISAAVGAGLILLWP